MENKLTRAEVMDFFKIWERELELLLQTYTLQQIRKRWVKVNDKIQVIPN